jgi:hypothetical protein
MKYLLAFLLPLAAHATEGKMFVEMGSILNQGKFIAGGGFSLVDKVIPKLLDAEFKIGVLPDKFGAGQYIMLEPTFTLKLDSFSVSPKLTMMHLSGQNHFVASTLLEVKLK